MDDTTNGRTPEPRTRPDPAAEWIPEHGGYWRVSGYRDVCTVLVDARRFSSMGAEIPRLTSAEFLPPIPFDLDPPHHGEVRRAVEDVLPAAAIDRLEPPVRAAARAMAARLRADAEFELMDDFAVPLVAVGMWHLLGLRQPDATLFADLSRDLMRRMWDPSGTARWERTAAPGCPAGAAAEPARPGEPAGAGPPYSLALEKYILHAIEHASGDDEGVLAALGRATWRTYFADRGTEMMGIVIGLVGTALANTVNALVSSVEHLGAHPADRRVLAGHPDRAGVAVEELLRLYPPQSPGRIAVRDTCLAGGQFRVGDSILASVWGANRDAGVYTSPGELVWNRAARAHLAFGAGRHRCVGALFARMVMAVALQELHTAIPDYQLCGRSAPIGGSPLRAPLRRLWVAPS
jgi:cytochrome P450